MLSTNDVAKLVYLLWLIVNMLFHLNYSLSPAYITKKEKQCYASRGEFQPQPWGREVGPQRAGGISILSPFIILSNHR